jgi:hypothetical protein
MQSIARSTSTAAAAGLLAFVVATPTANAEGPNEMASCLGKVFQAQAVEAPRTVSDRIHFIRENFLGDTPFGQVLLPLAQNSTCPS